MMFGPSGADDHEKETAGLLMVKYKGFCVLIPGSRFSSTLESLSQSILPF